MLLNESAFKKLIENLPQIEFTLEWEGEEGRAEIEGHQITSLNYNLLADFNIYESGTIDFGDYFTEPSFTSNGVQVDDISFEVFNNQTDEVIHLTETQINELSKQIESLISITA